MEELRIKWEEQQRPEREEEQRRNEELLARARQVEMLDSSQLGESYRILGFASANVGTDGEESGFSLFNYKH